MDGGTEEPEVSRLRIHGATLDSEIDGEFVAIDAYIVWDPAPSLVRFVSLSAGKCSRWIDENGHDYPDPDDEDGLS